jgi:hypothetical protein
LYSQANLPRHQTSAKPRWPAEPWEAVLVTAPPLPPPGDRYNCDLDHSGTTTAQDLVRLIDLLNGAGEFTSWLDETVPGACP